MRRATDAELREAQKAFVEVETPDLETVDRSTLERASVCPWQANAIESGKVRAVGMLAEAGEVVHQAFGYGLHSWIDSHGAMSRPDLIEDVMFSVRNCRPDLQPEAIRAVQSSVWSWAQLIYGIHPSNILAFDGGEDIERSGQLAMDFADLGVRYTSEIDLLYVDEEREVINEVDYKTGWKEHDSDIIRDSFQFQSHAALVLHKYPDRRALRLRVFDTRYKRLGYACYFPIERQFDWQVRIRAAIGAWRQSQQENPPTWPTTEGCSICPAATICPVADRPVANLKADPSAFVADLIAVEARAEAMRKLAAAHVDATKQEIQAPDGTMFGRNKPRTERKATATLYSLKE